MYITTSGFRPTSIWSVGRAIEAAFANEPDAAFDVDELCRLVYGVRWSHIEKKHRVAVLRTAKARPGLKYLRSERSGGMLIFYTPDNVMSYGMARLKGDRLEDPYQTNTDLRKRLRPGGDHHKLIVPGGVWHLHTEIFKAERDGDTKKLKELQREQDRALAAIFGR